MAPGSCSRRNAPPRSRLGTAIQMLLGTPSNKGLPHRAMLKPVVPNLQATKKALKKCKDHVNTAGAFDTNRIPFAALFLRGRISFRWHQYKRRKNQAVEDPLPWVEFKAFLRRSLSDSRAFVDTIWSRGSLQLGVSPRASSIHRV